MRMSAEAWREVLETNLFGAFWMTKAVTRPMLKARGGRIINITSVSGQAGQMGQANYSVGQGRAHRPDQGDRPRAGLARHHRQRRRPRLRPDRADPGPARGAQAEITERTPLGRFGTTEEIANAVAFLASDEAALHHRPGARRRRRPGDDVMGMVETGTFGWCPVQSEGVHPFEHDPPESPRAARAPV